jgi:hypothetical protein
MHNGNSERGPGRPASRSRMLRIVLYALCLCVLAPATNAAASTRLCDSQVNSSKWEKRGINAPYGWTLSIMPSRCGRTTGIVAAQAMLDEAVRETAEHGWKPVVSRKSMYWQLVCHLDAVIKTPYNLDAWRPDVGRLKTLRARCNPGPPAPAEAPAPQSGTGAPTQQTFPYAVMGTCLDGHCGLTKRSGPGFSGYDALGTLNDGDAVNIACQKEGETVGPSPATGNSSNIWDRLDDGSWISDLYTTTPGAGTFTAGIPRC